MIIYDIMEYQGHGLTVPDARRAADWTQSATVLAHSVAVTVTVARPGGAQRHWQPETLAVTGPGTVPLPRPVACTVPPWQPLWRPGPGTTQCFLGCRHGCCWRAQGADSESEELLSGGTNLIWA
jgi:hypothetical protein